MFTLNGKETKLPLQDFWQWSMSDLLNNSLRGILAEYIVASGLGISKGIRAEWDAYDLTDNDGTKLEVKASAYIQSWYQEKLSTIRYDIRKTTHWNPTTNKFEGDKKRQSDYYIFCLLNHKEMATIDPLNLDQWQFHIIDTESINAIFNNQKSVSLGRLLSSNPIVCGYNKIREGLDSIKNKLAQNKP